MPFAKLDIGRAQRTVTTALRRALVLRDAGCTFPGCDLPPGWCDVHHLLHWANGGPTDLLNTVLLCPRHHHTAHHQHWTIRIAGDGLPEFIPPPWIDPEQHPRRHHRHKPHPTPDNRPPTKPGKPPPLNPHSADTRTPKSGIGPPANDDGTRPGPEATHP